MAGIFFPSHSEGILTAKPNQQNFFWNIYLICMVVEFQIHDNNTYTYYVLVALLIKQGYILK